MKIRLVLVVFFVLAVSTFSIFAGDVASFINLGFSEDSGQFMFGYHGFDAAANKPFAEIYMVDVKANNFVPGGIAKEFFTENLQPGQDTSGALYTLLEKNVSLVNKFKIRHLRQGRLLYILLNGDVVKETLEFRDFNTQNQYSVQLHQNTKDSGMWVKSAFHITLTINKPGGGVWTYILGRPDYYRVRVMNYRIRQIFLSPDEKHLVCLIERDEVSVAGKSVRYMVETVKLR
jgi:predicted secreted protein